MRPGHWLLATTLLAGTATAAAAQDPERRPERREWIRLEPNYRRPMTDFYRFRMDPERMRIVERSLERAERVRTQALDRVRSQVDRAARVRVHARDRALDQLDRMRDREWAMRDRVSDRANSSLRRSLEMRERTMERVRERMDKLRDEHRYMIRRRLRTI